MIMKKVRQTTRALSIIVLTIMTCNFTSYGLSKDPVVIEVTTDHATIKEALVAAKMELLKEKFILQGGIQESSFTAQRSTGADADYYVADVMAEMADGKVKLTITFVKVGTGLLKLEKVADKIKGALGA